MNRLEVVDRRQQQRRALAQFLRRCDPTLGQRCPCGVEPVARGFPHLKVRGGLVLGELVHEPQPLIVTSPASVHQSAHLICRTAFECVVDVDHSHFQLSNPRPRVFENALCSECTCPCGRSCHDASSLVIYDQASSSSSSNSSSASGPEAIPLARARSASSSCTRCFKLEDTRNSA